MQGRRQKLAVGAAAVAVALALAGAALAALAAHSAGRAATTITVTEREYHITLSKRSFAAGKVVFVIHNTGKLHHALAVAGGGLHGTVRTPMIAPGKSGTLSVTLTSGGTVKVWCPVPGHAALGMSTSFAVHGGSGTASTPAPATTSGGSTWG
jgi:uncharacterized cupredoxin-like copper-binding protein